MHLRQINSWRPEPRPSQFPFVSALSWLGKGWQGDREVQSHIHKGQTEWKIRAEGGLGCDVATGRAADYSVPFNAQTNASHQCFPPAVSPTLLPKIPTKTSNLTSHHHFLPKLAPKLLPKLPPTVLTITSHQHFTPTFPPVLLMNIPISASYQHLTSVLATDTSHQHFPPNPTKVSHQFFPPTTFRQHPSPRTDSHQCSPRASRTSEDKMLFSKFFHNSPQLGWNWRVSG